MRLFVGIDLPEALSARLSRLIDQLRPLAAVRWSRAENLHVTTKFIGEWEQERLEEVKEALAAVRRMRRFPITLRGVGWFPNPHQPRVLWVGVDGGEPLVKLAQATEGALERLGIPAENRPYQPHLTLARLNGVRKDELVALRQRLATMEATEFEPFTVTAYHLYWSRTTPGGSIYTKLAGYELEEG
jgi:2'-5' RNA ligase